jgi:predicted ribosome quality control (RQC) complex YloA/Tae2 family protein
MWDTNLLNDGDSRVNRWAELGIDRVVDLQFGKGEHSYHILVELYAAGNVILTDHEYTILSLLRSLPR